MLIMSIKLRERKKFIFKYEGDENTIMGLPIKKIKEYLNKFNEKIFSNRKSN